ncbi:hypothetical protein GGS23DRAFT_229363 [Durotheca rogersii]|uniref:uncharacterized protein n=1 Tax=Durotheca rogersii TaxID=419775 RepID=UPI00221F869B|nr:uncharacterized protein GGS23DRAFT_229363 [Durotheca rogersii]KAI5860573.1 hypothetical protein GGS23DRAFT_229363 [Durotheca rogersii]
MLRGTGVSLWLRLLLVTAAAGAAVEAACGTPTTTQEEATATACENPNQTTGYPDYNQFCQCPPYAADSPAFGNPYLGLVRCDTKCRPANPAQTQVRPENDSLQACMGACTGSYEKARKRGELAARQNDDDYWYCHGVNFVQGQLCEFIGALGDREFVAGSGSDCWYLD